MILLHYQIFREGGCGIAIDVVLIEDGIDPHDVIAKWNLYGKAGGWKYTVKAIYKLPGGAVSEYGNIRVIESYDRI